jgi:hypothetical protein
VKILSIDPGNVQSAYCVYDTEERLPITFDTVPNEQIIQPPYIFGMAHKLVIEKVACYGMPVGETIFETCVWTGRFIQKFIDLKTEWGQEISWDRITRKEVVVELCGSAKAKDANVRQALIDLFGKPGTKKHPGVLFNKDRKNGPMSNDEWAALSIAVAYAETKQQSN